MRSRNPRLAFSFIELLVVITILGLLMAMLLPAVNMAREAARRVRCCQNLSQLILAVHSYQNLHGYYPPGVIHDQQPIRNTPQGYHHNWILQILPFLEQETIWRRVDQNVGVYHPNNAPAARLTLKVLECPSQSPMPAGQSCYAGVHHDWEAPIDVNNNGVFFLNSRIRYEHVTDGTSHTIFLGEILAEAGGLGWMSGTRATLRNAGPGVGLAGATGPVAARTAKNAVDAIMDDLQTDAARPKTLDPLLIVGGFGGAHDNFAFGDGRVAFLNASPTILPLLAHRADGKLLDGAAY